MWVQTLINILPQILFCCQLHHIILDGVIVVLDCMFLWFSYKFALLWQIFLRFPNFLYQLQPRYLPYHDTLVGRVMPKFFSNKFFLNDSHQCSYHNDLKIGLFVGYFLMGWVLIRAGVYCPHLWAQLVFPVLSQFPLQTVYEVALSSELKFGCLLIGPSTREILDVLHECMCWIIWISVESMMDV